MEPDRDVNPAPGRESKETSLKPNAVGFPGVLMQSVVAMSPALATLVTVQFTVFNAGVAAPLAYFGAFLVVLMLGTVLAQFAKRISSAGTYYTFVSRSIGGRAGFIVSWVYLLFYPIVIAQTGAYMGVTLQNILKSEYGITFHWWYYMLALIAIVSYTGFRGIELSVKVILVLGILEICIMGALGAWGFAHPGAGGINFKWLNPGNAPTPHAFFLGIVFSIFALAGWDASAPIAEESRDPRRYVPRGVICSILFLGVFVILLCWGQLTGWGTDHVASFASSPIFPGLVLAKRYWGGLWWIVLVAAAYSALALSIACQNTASRIFYAMGRTEVLPRWLAHTHPKYRTPDHANLLQTGINIAVGLGLSAAIGATNVLNVTGTMFTFAVIPVYILANIGVFRLYRRKYRGEFRILYHAVFPVVSTVALIVVAYESLNPPPAYPVWLAAPAVLCMLAVGAVILVVMRLKGREEWIARAGQATETAEDPVALATDE
jgi:amino acid transporter